jgi:hypothetical protein
LRHHTISNWSRMGLLHHGALHLSAVHRLLLTWISRRTLWQTTTGSRPKHGLVRHDLLHRTL